MISSALLNCTLVRKLSKRLQALNDSVRKNLEQSVVVVVTNVLRRSRVLLFILFPDWEVKVSFYISLIIKIKTYRYSSSSWISVYTPSLRGQRFSCNTQFPRTVALSPWDYKCFVQEMVPIKIFVVEKCVFMSMFKLYLSLDTLYLSAFWLVAAYSGTHWLYFVTLLTHK